jgi:hypothetical protein
VVFHLALGCFAGSKTSAQPFTGAHLAVAKWAVVLCTGFPGLPLPLRETDPFMTKAEVARMSPTAELNGNNQKYSERVRPAPFT